MHCLDRGWADCGKIGDRSHRPWSTCCQSCVVDIMYMTFNQVVDCERGDRVRAREVSLFFYGSVLSLIQSLYLWHLSLWPILIVFLTFCVMLLAQNVVNGSVLEDSGKPHRRWVKLSSEGVDFIPSLMPAVCEWACHVALFLSAVSAICVGQYVEVPRGPYSNGLLLGVATVFLVLVSLSGVPRSTPGSAAWRLTPEGLLISPCSQYRAFVDWSKKPQVEGRAVINLQECVVVKDSWGSRYYLPISGLPMSCVQFRRLLSFYSTHPKLRQEIASSKGVGRVCSLLDS